MPRKFLGQRIDGNVDFVKRSALTLTTQELQQIPPLPSKENDGPRKISRKFGGTLKLKKRLSSVPELFLHDLKNRTPVNFDTIEEEKEEGPILDHPKLEATDSNDYENMLNEILAAYTVPPNSKSAVLKSEIDRVLTQVSRRVLINKKYEPPHTPNISNCSGGPELPLLDEIPTLDVPRALEDIISSPEYTGISASSDQWTSDEEECSDTNSIVPSLAPPKNTYTHISLKRVCLKPKIFHWQDAWDKSHSRVTSISSSIYI